MPLLEAFENIASVLIDLSLMMENIGCLHWIGLFGAAAFNVCGYFIVAF